MSQPTSIHPLKSISVGIISQWGGGEKLCGVFLAEITAVAGGLKLDFLPVLLVKLFLLHHLSAAGGNKDIINHHQWPCLERKELLNLDPHSY